MFGSLGGAEILLILVLGLLLFGPRKLPQMGRMLGKSLSEFRRATQDFKMNLEHEVRVDERGDSGKKPEISTGTVSRTPSPAAPDDQAAEPSATPAGPAPVPPHDVEPDKAD